MLLRLVTSSLVLTLASASFCGDSAIPYSIEILADGQPVLGCARPTCFGWGPNGQPATAAGSFYRINNHADGFIRTGRDAIPEYGPSDGRYYRPQTAVCDHSFGASNCPGANQWVGGIAPLLNVSAFQTTLQCCTFDALSQSEDRGIASIHAGQIVVGGEVISAGIQVAFDYVSDLIKVVHADGTVQYDISIRRMACADLPRDGAKLQKSEAAQAFQAPNVEVDAPLALPGQAENAILEEVVQEEAVQLPAGTQFQPVQAPPPPPQFNPVAFQAPQFVPQAAPVAPAQYYPPVSYYGAGAGASWCFTGDQTVEMLDGTTKRMDELKKNDWVLAVSDNELEYVPVDFWLHRVPSQVAEFLRFETEDAREIKLTAKHFIFKGDCSRVGAGAVPFSAMPADAVAADEVAAGDCLYTLNDDDKMMHEVRVVRSSRVNETGIYAPMTSTGKILVNGVHASCHNIMQSHSMGHTVFSYVDTIYNMYDSLFGSTEEQNEIIETPAGLSTFLAVADLVMPKNLVTM